ncbi:hypothetical protein HYU50_02815 [Candidatus Woesearchaeota archaeon]|nr:hypothetical protein [Candidatus Woesearchaeota archaeon]
MRKHHDRADKTKKFMVYFIGFIMISSVFGVIFFGFGSSRASAAYNGFKFFNRGDFWSTNIDGREAMFTYFPSEIEAIPADDNAISRLKNKPQIDITSDINDTFAEGIALAQYQMGITLSNFNVFIRSGFTNQTKYNAPVITCSNSTNFVPVVYFTKGNATKIYMQGNCIIAEAASNADVIRLKDRLVYGILGIIK